MNLADFLRHQMSQRGWSMRDTERETQVSRTALDNIIKNPHIVPNLDTLAKLALTFNISLARIIEMCGFDLGEGHSLPPNDQLTALLKTLPQLESAVNQLIRLDPEDLKGILDYIEWKVSRGSESTTPS